MFRLKEQYRISSFDAKDDLFLAMDYSNSVTLKKNDKVICQFFLEETVKKIYICDDQLIHFWKEDNTIVSLKKEGEKFVLIKGFGNSPISQINKAGSIGVSSDWKSYFPIEIETKALCFNKQFSLWGTSKITSSQIVEDKLCSIEMENIAIYNLSNGDVEILVSNRTGDEGQDKDGIQNYLGIKDNRLWISFQSGKVVNINLTNGQWSKELVDIKSISNSGQLELQNSDILYGNLVQMDQNRIISLRDAIFTHTGLSQNEPIRKVYDVSETMDKYLIRANYRNPSYPSVDNFLFFCDDRQGKLGVFDMNRLKVVWSYELEMERNGIAQILEMKYENGFWYVLDRNNTLHVLERVA